MLSWHKLSCHDRIRVLIIFSIFLLQVCSTANNSTDNNKNNILIPNHKCSANEYYESSYEGCVSCTSCSRENLKTAKPCGPYNDATCGDCFDGYVKQSLPGNIIGCRPVASYGEEHSDEDDLDPNRSSTHHNAAVSHTSPTEIAAANDDSDSNKVKEPANNSFLYIMGAIVVVLAIVVIVLAVFVFGLRRCSNKITLETPSSSYTDVGNGENNSANNNQGNEQNDPLLPRDEYNSMERGAAIGGQQAHPEGDMSSPSDANTSFMARYGDNNMGTDSPSNPPHPPIAALDLSTSQEQHPTQQETSSLDVHNSRLDDVALRDISFNQLVVYS